VAADTKTVRGITVYKNKSQAIRTLLDLNDDPEIHGNKIWFSSFFIIDYLNANPPQHKTKIMEVGCGWGILSIYCAKKFNAKVTGVDADKNVFPFLKLHAKANGVKVKKNISRYENLKLNILAKQDLIVGGDICFWKELIEPLYKMINKAVKEGVPRIVIADPGRAPFLKLAKRCVKKFKAELIQVDISEPKTKNGYLLIIEN
jgi:predicted nicotinamide N-methyase